MNLNIKNYEEWMVDYLEGNLTKAQADHLMHFIEIHPELKAEFEAYQHTILQPDMQIVFSGKELLKKQEAGRVIAFTNWGKYAVGIAAALMLFVGVKFYNATHESVSGTQYSAQEITKPGFAFERKQEQPHVNTLQENRNQTPEIYLAGNKQNSKAEQKEYKNFQQTNTEENIAGNKQYQHLIDIEMATQAVEFASVERIDFVKHRGRIERDMNESNMQYIYANYIAPHNKQNENKSIIDKYNNTMAFAESVGSLLGLGTKEEQPDSDRVKETHIKIFDIEYYNRKTTDK